MKQFIQLFLPLLLCTHLFSDDVDVLLENIEKRTDLSEKTKLANSGVSFIWTRDDLDRMQISNLKQLLDSIYPFGYNENRYGLTDPLTLQSYQPSKSAIIRLYIDNQEITSGLYGSGLILLGNTNIDWVDHVEIYTQNPTYEYATESTIALIKLYTKSVVKDEGSKIKIAGGSYGKKFVDAYHAGWLSDWSYFVFGYSGDERRQKYHSHNTPLSKDKKVTMVTATLHKDETNILLHAFTQKGDAFVHLSLDATPEKSTIDATYFHFGIDSKIDHFSYLFTFSYSHIKSDMFDNVTPVPTAPFYGYFPVASVQDYTHDIVVTGELKYKKKIKNDTLLSGIKYRTKRATWDKTSVNGINMVLAHDTITQNIMTLYAEDQHLLSPSSLLTFGVEYQKVQNRDTIQSDDLWMYRVAHTYTTKDWTFKTFYAHTLTSLELYLIESKTFLSNPLAYYKPQTFDTLVEDIIYTNGNDTFEFMMDYTLIKDIFGPDRLGKIINFSKTLKVWGVDARWTKVYDRHNKLFLSGSYREIKNIPIESGKFKKYKGFIRDVHTYDKFDIFNELIYARDSITRKNFFNYSLGIQYHYTDDITIALKGINLFDDARQSDIFRLNPVTFQPEEPLRISPFDREILFSVSWVF